MDTYFTKESMAANGQKTTHSQKARSESRWRHGTVGTQAGEERLGVMIARVKKHRWHQKILKSSDPLVFSLGWRRFQSLPIYCTKDANLRMRFLKCAARSRMLTHARACSRELTHAHAR